MRKVIASIANASQRKVKLESELHQGGKASIGKNNPPREKN